MVDQGGTGAPTGTTEAGYHPTFSMWSEELRRYASETRSPVELAKLLQIRLSQSKVGRYVCPHPVERTVRLRSLGPVHLRSHTSDISVLNELVVSDGYVAPVKAIDAPTTILDLGANTGLAARWFRHRWPNARIACVEPEPGNVAALRRNVSGPGTTVLPYAVAGKRGTARLSTTNGEFGFTLFGGDEGDQSVEVDVVTMADVLAEIDFDHIDLLKVDIEGAESELFAHCAPWIDQVRWLIVECHRDYRPTDLLEDCRRAGAEFRVIDIEEKPEWGFSVIAAERVPAGVPA